MFWSFGTVGFNTSIENRVALNPWLGGVRDVAPAIISHEQTQLNRVCCFQTLNAVFPKDLFSDYLNVDNHETVVIMYDIFQVLL